MPSYHNIDSSMHGRCYRHGWTSDGSVVRIFLTAGQEYRAEFGRSGQNEERGLVGQFFATARTLREMSSKLEDKSLMRRVLVRFNMVPLATKGQAMRVIVLARRHACGNDSARIGLLDSLTMLEREDFDYAARRALTSLSYSVGVNHDDYLKAERTINQ